jgi:hypothetical protein
MATPGTCAEYCHGAGGDVAPGLEGADHRAVLSGGALDMPVSGAWGGVG